MYFNYFPGGSVALAIFSLFARVAASRVMEYHREGKKRCPTNAFHLHLHNTLRHVPKKNGCTVRWRLMRIFVNPTTVSSEMSDPNAARSVVTGIRARRPLASIL